MSNPYLVRLRAMRNPEKRHREEPSKPSKASFEGFEGDRWCHVLENHCLVEGNDVAVKNSKTPTHAYSQNPQNPSAPTELDGIGCRVEIIGLPPAGHYRKVFGVLQARAPAYVPEDRWRKCVGDGRAFLHQWAEAAQRLGWDSRDLFGLHTPPERPHPSYSRLSRYDCTGLIWLLQGRRVVALTEATAAIENPATGSITTYRRFNKPALGPLGDSLEDLK